MVWVLRFSNKYPRHLCAAEARRIWGWGPFARSENAWSSDLKRIEANNEWYSLFEERFVKMKGEPAQLPPQDFVLALTTTTDGELSSWLRHPTVSE